MVSARSIRAAGARAGDIVHVSYGYGLFTGGLGAHYGAEKLGLTVVPFGGGQTEVSIELTPGSHTLQLLLGDLAHVPHQPPVLSEKITIMVK